MTPGQWQRVKAVVQEALETDSGSRAAFLDQACGGDKEVRREVDQLLRSEQEMGDFLAAPAAGITAASADFEEGRRIGPYQLMREIGHGGMGSVYLAERADGQYRQSVAIKLIKAGLGGEAIVRRF